MMRNRLIAITMALVYLSRGAIAMAHEGHHKKPKTQPAQSQPVAPSPETANPPATTAPQEVIIEEEKLPPMSELMFAHMHNKIVHFPLALGLVGALFVFLSIRNPNLTTAAKILWGISAVLAVAAYFSGKLQEEPFEGTYLAETLELHETLGIITGIALWIGFLMLMFPRTKRFAVIWAIVLFLLISATGFYGGVLAHA
jgi:uncharacterized membrane protein